MLNYIWLNPLLPAAGAQHPAFVWTPGEEHVRVPGLGQAVHGSQFEPSRTLRAMSFFADGNLKELDEKVQTLLRRAASAVNPEDIPVLAARDGLTKLEGH